MEKHRLYHCPHVGKSGTRSQNVWVNWEAQRTVKRAEVTAFLCQFRKDIVLTMVYVDTTKRSVMGRGEERSSALAQDWRTPTGGS